MSFIELSALLAQTAPDASSSNTKAAIVALVVFALVVGPFLIGRVLAKAWRLPEYWWKIGLIVATLALATFIVATRPIPFGVDLKGGVILIYQVDEEATRLANRPEGGSMTAELNMNELMSGLLPQIRSRIDPSGNQQTDVRRYGHDQVEITIPVVEQIEVERIKRLLEQAGALEFRIVANDRQHRDIIEAAEQQSVGPNPTARAVMGELDGEQTAIGRWVRVARDLDDDRMRDGLRPFKYEFSGIEFIRDSATGQMLRGIPRQTFDREDPLTFPRYLRARGIEEVDVLMATNDRFDVVGSDLGRVTKSYDGSMNPCVSFSLRAESARKFAGLTRMNLPDRTGESARYSLLGIILDGNLLSAPRIQSTIRDQGQITGQFTQEEVDNLVGVLQAGKLPATLQKNPISENRIGPTLGLDTIKRGQVAIGISLVAVLLFIAVYYRFAGVIACLALLSNLVMIIALLILIQQDLTLPGLAGLVLTVGMSVDANVLILERIREERSRGGGLRMAIRNGFDRATRTIVDANITTLITAVVLYAIGTETVKGFAVTLIFGIVLSMFTAIFCTRVVLEIAERKRWIKDLKMMSLISSVSFDFLSKRTIALTFSSILIVVGIVAVVMRGGDIFDIDFTGGSSVTMQTRQPLQDADVRQSLEREFAPLGVQYTVTRIDVEGKTYGTTWRVDASLEEVEQLESILDQTFDLVTYSMSDDFDLKPVKFQRPTADPPADQETTPPATSPTQEQPTGDQPTRDQPTRDQPTRDQPTGEQPTGDQPTEDQPTGDQPTEDQPTGDQPTGDQPTGDQPTGEQPTGEQPTGDQPTGEQPTGEQPTGDQPSEDPPTESQPAAGEGGAAESGREETPENEPANGDSSSQPRLGDGTPTLFVSQVQTPAETDTATGQEESEDGDEADASQDEPKKPADSPAETTTEPAQPIEPTEQPAEPAEQPAEPATQPSDETDAAESEEPPIVGGSNVWTEAVVTFGSAGDQENPEKINFETLEDQIREAADALGIACPPFEVSVDDPDWNRNSVEGFSQWRIRFNAGEKVSRDILEKLRETVTSTPVWLSTNEISGKVAGDMQQKATMALLTSLLGIVGYIWFRFQKVVFGLAAVVALVHDVLIVLGAIAISKWLAGSMGFLLIEEFKISLPIVAAFLTIIGYSLNDTIVVFDRIREVRGRSPDINAQMINTSINQTLGRTVLTSLTTLIVVVILYIAGGSGIHGFAFALVIGVVVGTYSSIFVASPALLWMSGSPKPAKKKSMVAEPVS